MLTFVVRGLGQRGTDESINYRQLKYMMAGVVAKMASEPASALRMLVISPSLMYLVLNNKHCCPPTSYNRHPHLSILHPGRLLYAMAVLNSREAVGFWERGVLSSCHATQPLHKK